MHENNRRIARNTLMLYVRMLVVLGVSLFTSRIVLDALGESDFGIYNVVGGVVALFSFLNGTLSGATSRFLTYEMGKGADGELNKTFSGALSIHLALALVVFLLAETIGLWFLENKIVIPENRMNAARIVYQLSVFSCMLALVQIPYNASIIAHEKMGVYAYIGIAEAGLKFFIAYLLLISGFDKLILYGALMFGVTAVITFIYRTYCVFRFPECRFRLTKEIRVLKPMLSFSGWDLFGNMSVVAREQGLGIIENLFFGPVINAATGLAIQVQNAIGGFANNILTAIRPQIVKNYAANNMQYMQDLVFEGSKYSFLLLWLISLPIIAENKFLLSLWLVEVPAFAVIFCQLGLINNLISSMFRTIMISIHATGQVKRMSITNGLIFLSVLPIAYFLLKAKASPIAPFVVNIILLAVVCISNMYILKRYIPGFPVRLYLSRIVGRCAVIALLSGAVVGTFIHFIPDGTIRFIGTCLLSLCLVPLLSYYIVLDRAAREKMRLYIKSKFHV